MRVLISGGGIAGLTVANFLHRQGHQPIVIDKVHEFSNSGFVLSLKSFGVEILKELGLENKMRSIATKCNYANFYKKSGELIKELSYDVINKNLSQSIMATRGEIHSVLYESIRDNVEIQFGLTINEITQTKNEVTITLSNKNTIKSDLVIISEGIRSTSRKMVWNDSPIEDFNISYAAGRLQGKHSYKVGYFQTYRGLKKMLAILPLSENELAIQCYIHGSANVDNPEAIENGILSEAFQDYNNEVKGLLNELELKGGIFSDKIGMIHESTLHRGRVVLLGDAGYCPTPLSGMGASLSIFGAKALVYYIGQSQGDLQKALENFNKLMQPIILKFQNNARKNAKTFLPVNNFNLTLNNIIFRYVPNYFISKKMSKELTLTHKQRHFEAE